MGASHHRALGSGSSRVVAPVEPGREGRAKVSRTFRLFISSPFSDLEAERNALHREVFPGLQRLCESKGARFQAIDLRWGVSDEAGLDQRTMPLCLDEIARCQKADRPNFLILLGDRYGWRPLPATIPATEFDRIVERVDGTGRDRLTSWYLRDDNAVPPEYYLRPREPDGPFGTSDDPTLKAKRSDAWNREAAAMRADLLQAVGDLDLSSSAATDSEARAKYVASATEQEIQQGAFRVPDARDHVFCYLRRIDGLPADASARAYRDLEWPDGEGEPRPDADAARQQARLKALLSDCLPGNIISSAVPWETGGPVLDLDRFCTEVGERLEAAITERLALDEDTDGVSLEAEAHRRFADHLIKFFTGRRDLLDGIERHLEGRARRPLVVRGVSGSGKSSLLAAAALQAAAVPGRAVAMRFIGADSASTNGSGLIGGLCRQIGAEYGVSDPVPDDLQELTDLFPARLALATADKPLIVFIDALDQLTAGDAARRLAWLPAEVPEHAAIVVSTLPGDTFDAASSRTPEILDVDPMPAVEAEGLLDLWLGGSGRDLRDDQRTEVLRSFSAAGGLPLYLKLAFE
ncbi:MAG: DUF4062 domain-containing protein, partial [Actinobacteria bacterium]|nr:DUF4062 domain-containing protein [Actinomycetota bacterium]